MINNKREIKYVYVFGGVLSGLGKGIVASSLGYLLKSTREARRGDNSPVFMEGVIGWTFCII